MDEAFFIASKTVGLLVRAESWIVIGLLLAVWAGLRGRSRTALGWTVAVLVMVTALTAFPLGNPLLAALEAQYPAEPALEAVDGIIVLGGGEDLGPYGRWHGVQMNDAGERLIEAVELARRFPNARLIYTGGTAGLLANPDPGAPSRMVAAFWHQMGVPDAQVVLEDHSRTTSENASFTKALLQPQPGQHWVLVTSAWHMPRSMETFARAGWTGITAWPVDFRSSQGTFLFEWRLDDHLAALDTALKEDVGRLAYWVVGK
jgi:uncharacterized SAM-binding protein YcdF (DUF218 family)